MKIITQTFTGPCIHSAEEATESFEDVRDRLKAFVNARSREEVVFTKNATEALNIAAYCTFEKYVKPGDKIVVTEMEHHSNFVPCRTRKETFS